MQVRRLALPLALWAGLWAAGVALAADPPPIDDFPLGNPGPTHLQQMKARATFWAGALRDANSDADVRKVRDGLLADYGSMDARQAAYPFVEQASGALLPLLSRGLENDPLRQLKEVNLAMALSSMPQVTIQPALEAMVAHPTNPAVRYVGWKGYRSVRTRLFAQGMRWAQGMFQTVGQAAGKESAAPVLGMVFRAIELDSRPEAVPEEVWRFVLGGPQQVLASNWPRWCARVRGGDEEMADAMRKAVAALQKSAEALGSGGAERKNSLQMLVDLSYHAARAYIDARGQERVGEGASLLLRDCERALNTLKKTDKRFIEKPLTDTRASANPQWVLWWVDPAANENYGVLAWVEFLKADGVVQPTELPASGSSTSPATAATRPGG